MRVKSLLSVLFISFLPMNVYSRALRHIDMGDVKQKHHDKLVQKRILEEKNKKIIEELKYKNSPLFSNWRFEISEGMTSDGMFLTTLPATGDVDLTSLPGGDSSVYSSLGQGDSFGNYGSLPSTRIANSGSGSGINGGFDVGDSYLSFNGKDSQTFRTVTLNPVDTSIVDTISITGLRGTDSNGGVTPVSNLVLAYYNNDTGEFGDITVMTPSGPTSLTKQTFNLPKEAQGKNVQFYLYDATSEGQGLDGKQFIGKQLAVSGINNFPLTSSYTNLLDFFINVPFDQMIDKDPSAQQPSWYSMGRFFWDNILNDTIGWGPGSEVEGPPGPISGGTKYWSLDEDPPAGLGYMTSADYIYIGQSIYLQFSGASTYGISNISFQRKTPMNVFVPLDSPEATSFIRTDPGFAGLSEAEKKQKLKEMLKASDEYVEKIFGEAFPGSGAVPPGESGDTPGVEVTDYQPPSQESQAEIQKTATDYQNSVNDLGSAFDDLKKELSSASKLSPSTTSTSLSQSRDQKTIDILKKEIETRTKLQTTGDAQKYYSSPSMQRALDKLKVQLASAEKDFADKYGSTEMPGPDPQQLQKQLSDIDNQISDLKAQAKQNMIDAKNNEWKAAAIGGGFALGAIVGIGALVGSTSVAVPTASARVASALNALKKSADAAKAARQLAARSMGQNSKGRGMGDRWSPNQYQ